MPTDGFSGRIRRRAACAALVGLTAKAERAIAGGFVYESQSAGHALRDGQAKANPTETRRIPAVIVGGGIAGLSAAWWLRRNRFTDFVVLELEREAGGNSRFGSNEISAYPWGAHYVPVPNPESQLVRDLFTELGLFVDGQWEERWLCHSPQERLYLHGRWQDGIEPEIGLTREDHREFQAFAARIDEFRGSGQFRIPMSAGKSPDLALDRISFRNWLDQNGFRSRYLHWLADYSTRDDFGSASAETSAWAGLHYFAARAQDEKGPLTWPEGNGWIVRRLLERVGTHVKTGEGAVRIGRVGSRWEVVTGRTRYLADAVIYAAPAFLLPYLDPAEPRVTGVEWSPWLVANLTLNRMPAERNSEPAWDNVIYNSPSLGYVVATHQNVQMRTEKTVLTHYWALSGQAPREARRQLLAADWGQWRERILADLERAHRDIRQCVSRIDIFRNGHAMVRPTPGFLSSPERRRWQAGKPGFYWANADLSGFSLFEEAQYRGVEAARKALMRIGR